MIQPSNALQRLKEVLSKATEEGDPNQLTGKVLLEVMDLGNESGKLTDFYKLLDQAEEATARVISLSESSSSYKVFKQLKEKFILSHLHSTKWGIFLDYINGANILAFLESTSDLVHTKEPAVLLNEDFLSELRNELEVLFGKILDSELSADVKKCLMKHINNLLIAIRKYNIDGTQGLEQADKLFVSELTLNEPHLSDKDKKNPIYRGFQVLGIGLLVNFLSFSAADVISAIPAIEGYWVPKYNALTSKVDKLEENSKDLKTTQEIYLKALEISEDEPQKRIEGIEQKALPPSKENIEEVEESSENDDAL